MAESRFMTEREEDVFALFASSSVDWLQIDLAVPRYLSTARGLELEGTVLCYCCSFFVY